MADFPAFHLDDVLDVGVKPVLRMSRENMCRVYWRLADPDGQPIVNRRILFGNLFSPQVHEGTAVVGSRAVAYTDENGEGHIYLFRGTECDAIVDQTNIVRPIVVPDQPQADLFTLIGESQDVFTVQRGGYGDAAIRRS